MTGRRLSLEKNIVKRNYTDMMIDGKLNIKEVPQKNRLHEIYANQREGTMLINSMPIARPLGKEQSKYISELS